jgi:hypothetical protein
MSKESIIRDTLFLAIQNRADLSTMTRGRLIELTGNLDITVDDILSGKIFLLKTAEIIQMAQRLGIKIGRDLQSLF